MRATDLHHLKDVLTRENLPVPFGLILDPESFDELRRDIEEWAKDYCNFAAGDPGTDPKAPFQFMGLWFNRSNEPVCFGDTDVEASMVETFSQEMREFLPGCDCPECGRGHLIAEVPGYPEKKCDHCGAKLPF